MTSLSRCGQKTIYYIFSQCTKYQTSKGNTSFCFQLFSGTGERLFSHKIRSKSYVYLINVDVVLYIYIVKIPCTVGPWWRKIYIHAVCCTQPVIYIPITTQYSIFVCCCCFLSQVCVGSSCCVQLHQTNQMKNPQ